MSLYLISKHLAYPGGCTDEDEDDVDDDDENQNLNKNFKKKHLFVLYREIFILGKFDTIY